MKPTEVIGKNYLRNFLALLLLVLFIGMLISALALYMNLQRPLNTHYSAILVIIAQLKSALISKTIEVNITFIIFIIAGLGILTLIYTHRIAGPLHRIRMITHKISQGSLTSEIRLRRKDAVTSVAESLNAMTQNLNERITAISEDMSELKSSVKQYQAVDRTSEEMKDKHAQLMTIDKRIRDHFKSIRLEKDTNEE